MIFSITSQIPREIPATCREDYATLRGKRPALGLLGRHAIERRKGQTLMGGNPC